MLRSRGLAVLCPRVRTQSSAQRDTAPGAWSCGKRTARTHLPQALLSPGHPPGHCPAPASAHKLFLWLVFPVPVFHPPALAVLSGLGFLELAATPGRGGSRVPAGAAQSHAGSLPLSGAGRARGVLVREPRSKPGEVPPQQCQNLALCQSHPEGEETPRAPSPAAPVCHHHRRGWLQGPGGCRGGDRLLQPHGHYSWWETSAPGAGALAPGAGRGMPGRLRRSPYLARSPLRPVALLP